jgi:hypothetical protein
MPVRFAEGLGSGPRVGISNAPMVESALTGNFKAPHCHVDAGAAECETCL